MSELPIKTSPPAGWYPNPNLSPGSTDELRWWDGVRWTEDVDAVKQQSAESIPVHDEGSPDTTPTTIEDVRPRKWLGPRGGLIIAACFAAVWVFTLGLGLAFRPFLPATTSVGAQPGIHELSPILLLTGGIVTALALVYTMAYRLRGADGMSVPFLVLTGLVGGLLAALIAGPVNLAVSLLTGGNGVSPSPAAFALAGVVEELVKIAAVMVLARRLVVKNARTGLFVGGAVGFGFSAIENLSYLQAAWVIGIHSGHPIGTLLVTAVGRSLSGPFLHPMFTALLAAAIFSAARNGRYRVTIGIVGSYLAVAAAHGFFDYGHILARAISKAPLAQGGYALLFGLIVLAGTTIVWRRVARRVHDYGLSLSGGTTPE